MTVAHAHVLKVRFLQSAALPAMQRLLNDSMVRAAI